MVYLAQYLQGTLAHAPDKVCSGLRLSAKASAFANAELFPWTLANAAGGWLARHFGITGPNATYTGQVKSASRRF